ncbi:MAG: hypothetical protein ACYC9O_02195 [Candidatus Latescibacterota bacterium]
MREQGGECVSERFPDGHQGTPSREGRKMKRIFLTLIVFCVIFTSGAILTGALTLGDDMWLPYVGTVHYQMDDIPGVSPAKHFDALGAGYDCTKHAKIH